MPPVRDVNVDVKVKPRVAAGASTIATGTVTVAGYVAAIAAFASGARDEVTLTTLILGTVGLITFALTRVVQAVAAIKAAGAPAPVELEAAVGHVDHYDPGPALEDAVVAAVARGFREQGAGEALRKRNLSALVAQRDEGPAEDVDEVLLKDSDADDPDPGPDPELDDDLDQAGDELEVDGRPAYLDGVEDVPAHHDGLKD